MKQMLRDVFQRLLADLDIVRRLNQAAFIILMSELLTPSLNKICVHRFKKMSCRIYRLLTV
jgi:hypothetical protein